MVEQVAKEVVNAFVPDSRMGIEISDMALLPDTESDFETFLDEKLALWREQGVRSLQIKF